MTLKSYKDTILDNDTLYIIDIEGACTQINLHRLLV